jgi:hypothetical protein
MKPTKEQQLQRAKDYAKSRENGECLSTRYINATSKLAWQCGNETHQPWLGSYNSVVNKTWCPQCSQNTVLPREMLLKAHKIAKLKKGFCLSKEYVNSYTKMRWKCKSKLHPEWESKLGHILDGSWCPKCGIETIAKKKKLPDGLERAKKLAELNEGKCLSKEYVNAHAKMEWKCSSNSHPTWKTSYKTILNGSWCPKCADHIYYKENKVRHILNYLLDTDFIKSNPMWNINPKSKRLLELDGYSEQLKIAFEFQGLHHYQKSFNASIEDFEYIKYKDKIKKEHCLKKNIKLLIIDDGKHCDNNKELLEYVLKILANENIIIDKKINYDELQEILNKMTDFQDEALQKARKYAESHKGRCLSTTYTNAKDKLEWKCEDDSHPSFFANLRVIYRNSWCKRCSTKKQWKNNPPNKKQ